MSNSKRFMAFRTLFLLSISEDKKASDLANTIICQINDSPKTKAEFNDLFDFILEKVEGLKREASSNKEIQKIK